MGGLSKLVKNIKGGVSDVVHHPADAVKFAAGTAAGMVLPGYGSLYGKGGWMGQGPQGEGAKLGTGIDLAAGAAALGGAGGGAIPGFGGASAGTGATAGAAGATDAASMAGVMGSAGAGAGTDAVLTSAGASGAGGLGSLGGWGSFGPSIVQGVTGIFGANAAANAQKAAADKTLAFNERQAAQTRADLMPYNTLGQGAGGSLANFLGIGKPTDAATFGQGARSFTPEDFLANKDPGYEFTRRQGELALQNSQAAGSGVLSGAAIKGLIDYNQGVARTGYNDAFNRFQTGNQNTYNRLAGLLQIGQNAAAGSGTIGANLAGNSSNAITAGGNAAASGIVGTANAVNGAINNYQGLTLAQQLLSQQRQPSAPNTFTGPG